MGTLRAAVTAVALFLSNDHARMCVTLPTMALRHPRPTRSGTVMAGSPWLDSRLSASIWAGTCGQPAESRPHCLAERRSSAFEGDRHIASHHMNGTICATSMASTESWA